jgi:hypothetical protein
LIKTLALPGSTRFAHLQAADAAVLGPFTIPAAVSDGASSARYFFAVNYVGHTHEDIDQMFGVNKKCFNKI